MKKLFLSACSVWLLACNSGTKTTIGTTPSGIRYTIYRSQTEGQQPLMLSTVKVTVTEFVKDSAFPWRLPDYKMVLPPAPFAKDPVAEVLMTGETRLGDSIVTEGEKRLAFVIQRLFTPGVDGINVDSVVQADKSLELKYLFDREIAIAGPRIAAHLKKAGITAEPTSDHIYVQIQQSGVAPFADSGRTARINYEITELVTGRRIMSNRDSLSIQPPVVDLPIGRGFFSKAVDRVVANMGKGGHVTFYIPGVIAAGDRVVDTSADLRRDVRLDLKIVGVK